MIIFLTATICLKIGANEVGITDTWHVFEDKGSALYGFKDAEGSIRVKAEYPYINGAKFDDIIAVAEKVKRGNSHEFYGYYITKPNKKVANAYAFKNKRQAHLDCESEGFIRFTDHIGEYGTIDEYGQIGMLNKKGGIVIPAEYDYLSRVMNGFIVAQKGGEKKINTQFDPYIYYEGGKQYLIDTDNQVIIEDFKGEAYWPRIDYYSVIVGDIPSADEIRESFLATNGKYYSFIHYEAEFRKWFEEELRAKLSKETLLKVTTPQVSYNKKSEITSENNKIIDSNTLIHENYEEIKQALNGEGRDYPYALYKNVSNYAYEENIDRLKYSDNCGEAMLWKYPHMQVQIFLGEGDEYSPLHIFEFIRTNEGYKLYAIEIYAQ